jgi:glycosyltransferase A (GT-A) superfamily protein (DUF2064 family)
VLGVAMSRPDTGARQLRRLVEGGLRVLPLPALTDVDTADEAGRVAALLPGSRFATCLYALGGGATQQAAAIR